MKFRTHQCIEEIDDMIAKLPQFEGRWEKKSIIEYRIKRLKAAREKLQWLQDNEAELLEFIKQRKEAA